MVLCIVNVFKKRLRFHFRFIPFCFVSLFSELDPVQKQAPTLAETPEFEIVVNQMLRHDWSTSPCNHKQLFFVKEYSSSFTR